MTDDFSSDRATAIGVLTDVAALIKPSQRATIYLSADCELSVHLLGMNTADGDAIAAFLGLAPVDQEPVTPAVQYISHRWSGTWRDHRVEIVVLTDNPAYEPEGTTDDADAAAVGAPV